MAEITRKSTRYRPEAVGIGIVHLGLGAFHRAHQAAYVESWLNRNGGGDWGICAANIRSNAAVVRQLESQNFRYHLAAYASRSLVELIEISAIRRALFARDDPRELLEQMTAEQTRIVSLTVSEKGYYLSPATGTLLVDAPEIRHDLRHPSTPRTAPGLVLEALRRRRALNIPPFTVLCCDNMPDNGPRTQQAICTLAAAHSKELERWIADCVAFPASMVDRIVPAVTDATLKEIESLLGFQDMAAVATEAFSQWVIEDRFCAGRPDWESEGVEMVSDVAPYETLKLRLLNGAHSLLAYVGLLRNRNTVAEAIADDRIAELLRVYLSEARSSLDPLAGLDVDAYIESLVKRFENDALEHRLSQIAMDGSQKLPQRWLLGARDNLERGHATTATAAAVGAWMVYVSGTDSAGRRWNVDDPMADKLAACGRDNRTAAAVVDALLAIVEVFPERVRTDRAFRDSVLTAFIDWTNPPRLGQSC